jgi:hypothetical protein
MHLSYPIRAVVAADLSDGRVDGAGRTVCSDTKVTVKTTPGVSERSFGQARAGEVGGADLAFGVARVEPGEHPGEAGGSRRSWLASSRRRIR